jgi:hypothetical protein
MADIFPLKTDPEGAENTKKVTYTSNLECIVIFPSLLSYSIPGHSFVRSHKYLLVCATCISGFLLLPSCDAFLKLTCIHCKKKQFPMRTTVAQDKQRGSRKIPMRTLFVPAPLLYRSEFNGDRRGFYYSVYINVLSRV